MTATSLFLILAQATTPFALLAARGWLPSQLGWVRLLGALVLVLGLPVLVLSWLLFAGLGLAAGSIFSGLTLLTCAALSGRPGWDWSRVIPWRVNGGIVSLAVLIGLSAVSLFASAIKPEIAWDSLMYHMPAVANMIAEGSLWGWQSSLEWTFYPESIGTVNAVWIGATDRVWLEDAVAIAFLPIAFVAVLGLSESWSAANRSLRAVLVAFAFLAPVVWLQLRMSYVDFPGSAMLLGAVALTAGMWRSGRVSVEPQSRAEVSALAVIVGIALGVGSSAKPSLLLPALVVFVWCLPVMMRNAQRLALLALPVAAVGAAAPFYLRNLIEFNNPVFPVASKFGPISFDGVIDASVFSTASGDALLLPGRLNLAVDSLVTGISSGVSGSYDPGIGGFGQISAVLVSLLLLWATFTALVLLRRRRDRRSKPYLIEITWTVSLAAVVVMVTPNPGYTRYALLPFLLVWGIGLSPIAAVALRRWISGVMIAAVAGGVVLAIYDRERAGNFSIAESLASAEADPAFNTGVTSPSFSLHDNFAWLPKDRCVRIVVQKTGIAGFPADGWMNQFQYGFWGDRLCNRPEFITLGPEQTQDPRVGDYADTVADSDYLVVYESDIDFWSSVAAEAQVRLVPVSQSETIDWAQEPQLVFRVVPDRRSGS